MNAETKAALVPCPFCGAGEARPMTATLAGFSGVELISDHAGGHVVWCGTCGAAGPPEVTDAARYAAWNRRAHIASETSAYEAGKADAVAQIVAWLNNQSRFYDAHKDAGAVEGKASDFADVFADAIASGAHERNGDD
jgi:hypothetical protein